MKKIYLIAAAMLIILVVVYFVYRKKKPAMIVDLDDATITPEIIAKPGTLLRLPSNWPLRPGIKSRETAILQTYLNQVRPSIFNALKIDGIFGTNTLTHVRNRFGSDEVTVYQYNAFIRPMESFYIERAYQTQQIKIV
jgi:hypothetical protein